MKVLYMAVLLLTICLTACTVSKSDSLKVSEVMTKMQEIDKSKEIPDMHQEKIDTDNLSEKREISIDMNGAYEITTREVYIESDSGNIYAVFYMPVVSEDIISPGVIYAHGFNNTNTFGASYARQLASQGYVACCFDFRGGGIGSKSEGSSLDMTVFTEQEDLEAVLSYMQEMENVDTDQIFLWGNSQGGVVATLTTAANEERVAGLILSSPAFVLFENARNLYPNREDIPEETIFNRMPVGYDYWDSAYDYDIDADMQSIDNDVLILIGDRDGQALYEHAVDAANIFPNAELVIMEGEGHLYSSNGHTIVMQNVTSFLKEHTNEN